MLKGVLADYVVEVVSGGGFVVEAEGVGGDADAAGELLDVVAGVLEHELVGDAGPPVAVGEAAGG